MGYPGKPQGFRLPLEERFWPKVDRRGSDECWEWRGAKARWGYGNFNSGGQHGRTLRAHRVAYELLVGPIPEGLDLDHLCRNRACVNPAHLEPVTRRENILRGETVPGRNATKTHCKRGHEFTPENTYLYQPRRGNVQRFCRRCLRLRDQKRAG